MMKGGVFARFALALGSIGVAVAGVGCAYVNNRENSAANAFVQAYQCPRDRVVVRPVATPSAPSAPGAAPPDDVARDPERLAIWKKQQQRPTQDVSSFDVTGCGHEAVYGCTGSFWANQSTEGPPGCGLASSVR
jgi:hypothetical protein